MVRLGCTTGRSDAGLAVVPVPGCGLVAAEARRAAQPSALRITADRGSGESRRQKEVLDVGPSTGAMGIVMSC
jgi:hypothetical protein